MLVTALISLLILIFVAVILHCGIALVASYSEAGKSRLHGIPTQSRRQVIDGILRFVLSFFCFFVGDNWRSWNNVARLALVYYILLPNLMYFRAAESLQNEQWHFRAPFVYLIIMNSWILINL